MRRPRQYGRIAAYRAHIPIADLREKVAPGNGTTGFGIRTIRLDLPRTTYAAGDAVEGHLLLTIAKTIRAKGLFAILSAEQQFQKPADGGNRGRVQIISKKIYHYQQQLDTEHEYKKTEGAVVYPFLLVLPPLLKFGLTTGNPPGGLPTGPDIPRTGTGLVPGDDAV